MPDVPVGTVTFLFTDIEGSTKRWEHQPQQMQRALARHDEILRNAIEAEDGYTFKTVGDAFYAAFRTPLSALFAALSAQRAIQSEEWDSALGPQPSALAVRMALHTGMIESRDGDYFGQPLNRVARLLSAGHGGQTLLSEVTYGLVRDTLPPGVSMLDLGEHRLKDLTRPERVFQLVAPDLPTEFPPLKSLDNRPNNLPRQATALIGREKEVEAISTLLRREETMLVTLTGPGGTGKTRLGLQTAADLLDDFADGVWFVELAALTDHNLVASSIAQVLGVKEAGGQPLVETLKSYLKGKRLLLVLDNFEHLLDAASVVDALLKSAPGLKVLVTSRLRLGIYGEKEYGVPPLALPDPLHLPSMERLSQYEAVRLFIERAQDAKSDFAITNENAPAVAEICARLDGLPLAIELAAARVRLFSPAALLSRLTSRLKMLTGGARNLPARQQTLRGAIEWSYDLLGEGEKQLFRRMAVFQGGRTLGALEIVCDFDGRLQGDVLEGVESLVSKSLLQQREGRDGEPRFVMLETIHEYAKEKLQENGEREVKALETAHALYFMGVAEEGEPHLVGSNQLEWLSRLDEEHDNLRQALTWARNLAEKGNPNAAAIGLRTAGALLRYWKVRSHSSEAREALDTLLSLAWRGTEGSPEPLWAFGAKALYGSAVFANWHGDIATYQSRIEESLATYRKGGDKRGVATVLSYIGGMHHYRGDIIKAGPLFGEALEIFRELGDKADVAWTLINIAALDESTEGLATVRALYEEGLALFRSLGFRYDVSSALTNLGGVAIQQGNYSEARLLYEESLAIDRELGYKRGITAGLGNLGIVDVLEGNFTSALILYERGLAVSRENKDPSEIVWYLMALGNLAMLKGDYFGARAPYIESLRLSRDLEGFQLVMVCLVGLGGAAAGMGQGKKGTALLGAGEMLREASGVQWWGDCRAVYAEAVRLAHTELTDEEFERAWEEGRKLNMDQAIAYALEEGE